MRPWRSRTSASGSEISEALRGISFHVGAGEIYGLLGPNGAGKSTAINILCGLVTPDAGSARLNGLDVVRQPLEARRTLGVVPQDVAVYQELSARDNLAFFGRLYGLRGAELRARIDEILQRVSLADRDREPVRQVLGRHAAAPEHRRRRAASSPGRALRRADGRARSADAAEHPGARSRRSRRTARRCVYTTHYLDEAERLCDRIGIIDHGAILAEGTLAELRRAAGEREIAALRGTFRADAVPAALGALPDVQLIKVTDSELLVSLASAERQLSALLPIAAQLGEVREVAVRQPSLENLFIKLTGRELRE